MHETVGYHAHHSKQHLCIAYDSSLLHHVIFGPIFRAHILLSLSHNDKPARLAKIPCFFWTHEVRLSFFFFFFVLFVVFRLYRVSEVAVMTETQLSLWAISSSSSKQLWSCALYDLVHNEVMAIEPTPNGYMSRLVDCARSRSVECPLSSYFSHQSLGLRTAYMCSLPSWIPSISNPSSAPLLRLVER